ncbi:small integral membrane protein 20 isoform X2 [Syngnathus typhle]|uniref:small integral membrane protein 20 isoform X2 n=1 Tax=Syngnathus typhle TaxID=161592 RepID=UPI002A6AC457|nr:small integral membrane protein 20 isoform X2 [Syngnathus typhle]
MSKNHKTVLIFGGFITAVAAAFYPIFYYPLTHKNEYSGGSPPPLQEKSRRRIAQESNRPTCSPLV